MSQNVYVTHVIYSVKYVTRVKYSVVYATSFSRIWDTQCDIFGWIYLFHAQQNLFFTDQKCVKMLCRVFLSENNFFASSDYVTDLNHVKCALSLRTTECNVEIMLTLISIFKYSLLIKISSR